MSMHVFPLSTPPLLDAPGVLQLREQMQEM